MSENGVYTQDCKFHWENRRVYFFHTNPCYYANCPALPVKIKCNLPDVEHEMPCPQGLASLMGDVTFFLFEILCVCVDVFSWFELILFYVTASCKVFIV